MSIRDCRSANRRQAALIEVTLHVGGAGRRLRGRVGDITHSGMVVEMAEPIPEGRRVDVVLRGAGLECAGIETIATSGIVVHHLRGFGVGIRFSRQTQRTQSQIDTLLRLRKSAE